MARKNQYDEADAEEAQPETADDAGADQVQAKMDEEQEQGYRGFVPDPTPNANYTVAGVTSGAPTPETDDDAFNEARKKSNLR